VQVRRAGSTPPARNPGGGGADDPLVPSWRGTYAAQITGARWIHIGSVTHAFDAGQRANTLVFSPTATGVDVTVPASPNLAPPGHYLLFILNRNGVPSVAKIVQLLP